MVHGKDLMDDLKIIQSYDKHIMVGDKWKRWIQSDTDLDTDVGTFMDTNLNMVYCWS